ncbi:hypothetical protein GCM10028773_26340 [Spirosoma koreense]
MFRQDQWKALGALFTFSARGQDRYAEKRFAPHSEKQLHRLIEFMNTYGFPGEQLVGNGVWATVILSHHTSISTAYVLKDTLYPSLRPRLFDALKAGQISPYELATIEDWYVAVRSNHQELAYGYLSGELSEAAVRQVDQLREQIGLSRVATIQALLEIQRRTGLNFYLPFRRGKK